MYVSMDIDFDLLHKWPLLKKKDFSEKRSLGNNFIAAQKQVE